MYRTLATLASLVFVSQAFAWGGNGTRPSQEPKIPADTDASKKAVVVSPTGGEDTLLTTKFRNSGRQRLLCDTVGQVTVTDGGAGSADIRAYAEHREVNVNMEFEQRFVFATSTYGKNYYPIKKSQKIESACLQLDPGDTPAQVPSPHTMCDPEFQDCDWSCKANTQNPAQCENPSQDWPNQAP